MRRAEQRGVRRGRFHAVDTVQLSRAERLITPFGVAGKSGDAKADLIGRTGRFSLDDLGSSGPRPES
jgi:hypothetical protein